MTRFLDRAELVAENVVVVEEEEEAKVRAWRASGRRAERIIVVILVTSDGRSL